MHSLKPNQISSNSQCLMALRECNSNRQTHLVAKRKFSQLLRLLLLLARRRKQVNAVMIFLIWVTESRGLIKASASTDTTYLLVLFKNITYLIYSL